MKITYNADADAVYIYLDEEAKVDSTKEIDKDMIIDYDKEGKIIRIELLFVKEKRPELLKQIKVENLIVA